MERNIYTCISDPEGDALTTIIDWYDDEERDVNRLGRVKKIVEPTGAWTLYEYTDDGFNSKETTGWLDGVRKIPVR